MKKFVLSIFVIMSMFLFCDDVFASYTNKIYVANTEITSSNASDVLGDGKVSYDETNHILTLTDFELNSTGTFDNCYSLNEDDTNEYRVIYIDMEDDVTIKFVGDSKIIFDASTSDHTNSIIYNFIRSTEKVNIIGVDGATLDASVYNADYSYLMFVTDNDLSISNLDIKYVTSNVFMPYTLYVDDRLTLSNTKIDIDYNDGIVAQGIYSIDGIEINKSKIDVSSNANIPAGSFYAIMTDGGLDFIDSSLKVTSKGETTSSQHIALYTEEETTIDNSEIDINLRSTYSYGIYLCDHATISNSKILSTFDMTTQTDTNFGIYAIDSMDIKDSICKLDGTEGTLSSPSIVLDGGVFILSNIIDTVNVTYKNIDLNEVYLSNESFEKINVASSLDDIQGSHYILISADKSTYEYLEGKDSKLDINKSDTLKLRVDGIYYLFKDMSIDGVKYVVGEDINVSEGSTIIEFTTSGLEKIKKLSLGEHTVEVNYLNGKKATTTLNLEETKEETKEEEKVVENKTEETIENPKTGDNILINISLLIVSLVSIVYFVLKKKKTN